MEALQTPGAAGIPPIRTSSGGPLMKVMGFDTSPSSVISGASGVRFREQEESDTPSPGHQRKQVSPLSRALSQGQEPSAQPRLTIRTQRDLSKLRKSKSHADLRRPAPVAIPAQGTTTQPSSPQSSHSQGSSKSVRIPFELSRARTSPDDDPHDVLHEFIQTPLISAASSLASQHRAFSPVHRSYSMKELFEAHADAVTAQAQVQGLHTALKREHEEVLRLREQLSLVTAERDRLLQDLRESSICSQTPRVFDMDDALRGPFSSLRLR